MVARRGGGPALEGGQVTIAGWQDPVGDEQLTQVLSTVGEGECVDAVVAEWNLTVAMECDALATCRSSSQDSPRWKPPWTPAH